MERSPLSFAEVLNEELLFLGRRRAGRPTPTDESPQLRSPEWQFSCQDFRELRVLQERIDQKKPPSRYELLKNTEGNDYCERFNRLAADQELLAKLLCDKTFAANLLKRTDIVRRALDSSALRRTLLNDSTIFGSLLSREMLRCTVAGGDEVADLLSAADVIAAVRARPQLLGSIIISPTLREVLAQKRQQRSLAVLAGVPKQQSIVSQVARAVKNDFLKLIGRHSAPPPARIDEHLDFGEPSCVLAAMHVMSKETYNDAAEEIRRININLLEIAFAEHVVPNREVHGILDQCRALNTTALCLSGGGIRSATFNLGILQGLARKGVLPGIDYLSTVSGGGYIGGWFSSWMRRHDEGPDGVFRDLANSTADPLQPEVKPLQHLREYSDYLAPRYGMFSADTWTLITIYLRNLLLNWTLLVPLLAAILVLPRFFEAMLLHGHPSDFSRSALGISGIASLFLAMAQVGRLRPARPYVPGAILTDAQIRAKQREVSLWLGPGLLATFLFAVYWGWHTKTPPAFNLFRNIAGVLLSANAIGAAFYIAAYLKCEVSLDSVDDWPSRLKRIWNVSFDLLTGGRIRSKVRHEVIGVTAAAAVGAALLTGAALWFSNPTGSVRVEGLSCPEWFTLFGVPSVLLMFFAEATVLIGIITNVSIDHEREWWARSAAWLFIVSLVWLAGATATIVAPLLILQSPKIIASMGGVAGVATLIIGRSSKTPAQAKGEVTMTGKLLHVVLGVVATVFLVIVLGAISLAMTTGLAELKNQRFRPPVAAAEPASLVFAQTSGKSSQTTFKVGAEQKTNPFDATPRSIWLLHELRSTEPALLLIILGILSAIALAASQFLDSNVYSMHGMYRNRLIRGYLGASRWQRRPEPFTGFDPQDDLQMYELRPELLWLSSFKDFDGFLETLKTKDFLWQNLPEAVQHKVKQYLAPTCDREKLRRDLAGELLAEVNHLMLTYDLYTNTRAATSLKLLHGNSDKIRKDFADYLRCERTDSVPLHIVNMTLNLVSGEKLAWRDRKAASFSVTSLHAGNRWLGYRDATEYGGPRGISLGTAMAISGAAVSPNRGYSSSPIITFLLTLFNARLGWWLGNPGAKGHETYRERGPKNTLKTLVAEALGNTNDENEYVFLSDGGHFDNLGLYEAVLRRARRIIVCDATADGKYAFGDLANAVRKIRIDLGIPIHFETMYIGPTEARDNVGKYCALGGILYSCIDAPPGDYGYRPGIDGNLIYIKPAVYGDCPTDVSNYKKENSGFPHESTADQFFSETQFESYRALGSHVIDEICQDRSSAAMSSPDFFYEAYKYLHDATARKLASA
jgi:hypothetical protein